MDMYAASVEVSTDVAFMYERFHARSFVITAFLHGTPRLGSLFPESWYE